MNGNQFKKTVLISALLLELSTGAQAATIHVDGSTCILADAITAANDDAATNGCSAGSGADILELPNGADIVFNTALPALRSDITINGNNSTIRRNHNFDSFPVLYTFSSNITLNDLTITRGSTLNRTKNYGGGIRSFESVLTINRCQIVENLGGAIYMKGDLGLSSINDSIISNNNGHTNATAYSSGLTLLGVRLNINRSTIAGNLTRSGAKGGGLFISQGDFSNSQVTISNSTISGNSTSSGGGAIHQERSRFYMFFNSPTLTLNATTLTNNSTNQDGGAIFNFSGTVKLKQNIISGNSAGNLVDEIANVRDDFSAYDSTVISEGYNLIGIDGHSGSLSVNLDSSDSVITSYYLSDVLNPVLSNNGGLTQTHELNPSGPAIDFIPSVACFSAIDQTGKARPIDANGNGVADCDAGAYENISLIFKNGFE